jgi:hypothetical protein
MFNAAADKQPRQSDGTVASPKQRPRTNARSDRTEAKPVVAVAEGTAARSGSRLARNAVPLVALLRAGGG